VKDRLIIGTRGSALALAQTRRVAAALEAANPGLETELRVIRTTGDAVQKTPLSEIGDRGLFVREIEEALLRSEVDLAVHSLKDLPSADPEDLCLAAVPCREDARDALITPRAFPRSTPWAERLPQGATVGTSSLRRKSQLLHLRPDLLVTNFRGNVDTRLRKLSSGDVDACILACAGLDRLGVFPQTGTRLPLDAFVPAPGQGALALQSRRDDARVALLCSPLEDPLVRGAVTAERRVMSALQGGCQVPLGVHARPLELDSGDGPRLATQMEMLAFVASPDGQTVIRATEGGEVSKPIELADRVVSSLRSQGVEELLGSFLEGANRVD
jgi:hydroxymethylbilane synthase